MLVVRSVEPDVRVLVAAVGDPRELGVVVELGAHVKATGFGRVDFDVKAAITSIARNA